MASRRIIVAATTADALSDEDIASVDGPSTVSMFASCVTVTDTVGLRLDKTIILDEGILNIHAAALGLCRLNEDGLVIDAVIGEGTLRAPVTVTTSAILHFQVDPIA